MTAVPHPIPDDALDADIAILGKKGRGKTYTAKGIVERLLDLKRRVLVLDPLSTWWGLRSSADGTGEGYPVAVIGGPKADLPLSEAIGTPLARIIAENNMPTVIDMGEMRKAAWQRLVGDLLEELWITNRDPLWIVLEEADVFAPQTPGKQDASTRVLGEVDRIARRGRAYGFRLISITQRPARINKDVLTQLSTLVALGVTSPQDRDAIKAWVDGNADNDRAREVIESLASLSVGEGWVWSPDHAILDRVSFPQIRTLDTSKTPKAGEQRLEPTCLADVDLSAIRAALQQDETEDLRPKRAVVTESDAKQATDAAFERGVVSQFEI
ncbi:ATP-binding protein [Rhodobium gokarnense]|uniref:DNA helicase HerA-like ATPase n=1 Tax=Rhodobium gokarnense TaxID=364296 RepID=A0ABT3HH04_9HYPH|nr:helicase HerA-like domain-containing protein [Rhodobium gokarnense]MCW2309678.1 DNA helicase HerA-like ATPase [Rhodobium gokarnense]